MASASARAQQQTGGRDTSAGFLPDSPPSNSDGEAQRTLPTEGLASVVGTVLDVSGAGVPGAQVNLQHADGTQLRTIVSKENGEFSFTKIIPGSYLVIVDAKGFAPFTSAEFVVTAQQAFELPDVSLAIATANMELTVRPTDLVAAEQIKAEEKQRFIGIIPNFYTSYVYDAAPLTAKQKLSLAARSTFDPTAVAGAALSAGMEQANNTYAGYGQGLAGYSKRFAARYADGRSSDLLTRAVFPALLHQDPRYYYQGSGTVKSRVAHAVGSAFVTRSDSGATVPNYSFWLGDISAAALSNLYYPRANRGTSLVFTNAALGLAGRVGSNLVREFLKRLNTNALGDGKQ